MHFKTIHMISVALATGEEAIEGAPACIHRGEGASKGKAVASQVDPDLIPIGRFKEDLEGNGSKLVKIELFNAKKLHWFANSGSVPVDADDLLGPAYFTAAGVVGVPADPSTYSFAGRVWIVESTRVALETADAIGLQGPPGEDA